MFRKVNVPVIGIVENMSYFICRHCGEREEIFGHGGGKKTATMLGVPFLGEVPIDPKVVVGGDSGEPIIVLDPAAPASEAFRAVARYVIADVAKRANDPELAQLLEARGAGASGPRVTA